MLEKEIEWNIICFLREIGLSAYKVQNTATFDPSKKVFRKPGKMFTPGHADIHGTIPDVLSIEGSARPFYIEVKPPKGVVSDAQRIFLRKEQEHGAVAFVARSVEQTFDQLRSSLKDSDKFLSIVNKYKKLEAK